MYDKEKLEPLILFASPPSYEEVCAITVHVTNSAEVGINSQPHVIRCRELIFTEPDIIASPAYDYDQCFYVILQHKLYKTGRLQCRFEKKGAKTSNPYRVLPALFQACLRYTLTAKIAPLWNMAGEWLLQGRDFVVQNGYMNAIKMNLIVNSSEVYISVHGNTMKCSQLEISDLDVDTISLTKMLQGDYRFQILELDQWCFVLPSMKKGRIVSVSTQIPQYDCPFKTYRDLKKHWKNTYGYRLPETDEGILYYQVTFRPLGGQLFTYPNICLRRHNFHPMPRVDPKPIITSFLKDMHNKIQLICRQPFKFQPKVRYPEQSFHSSVEISTLEKPNLVSKNPNPPTVPLRNVNRMQPINNIQVQNSVPKQIPVSRTSLKIPEDHNGESDEIFISQTKEIHSFCNEGRQSKTLDNSKQTKTLITNGDGKKISDDASLKIQSQSTTSRIIPLFRPKSKLTTRVVYKPEKPKMVPAFTIKQSVNSLQKPSFSTQTLSSTTTSQTHNLSVSSSQPKTLPIFNSQKTKPSFTTKQIHKTAVQTSVSSSCPSFKSKKAVTASTPKIIKKMPLTPKLNTSKSKPSPCQINRTLPINNERLNQGNAQILSHNLSSTPKNSQSLSQFKSISTPKHANIQTPSQTSFSTFGSNPKALATPKPKVPKQLPLITPQTPNFTVADPLDTSFDIFNNIIPSPSPGERTTGFQNAFSTPKPMIPGFTKSPCTQLSSESWLLKTPDGKAKKRKEHGTPRQGDGSEPKKPRPKPKLQDVDVEHLARVNQLGKVNALTLTTWLKQRNMVCKAKDKKGDLVDKVFSFLNLAKPVDLMKSSQESLLVPES